MRLHYADGAYYTEMMELGQQVKIAIYMLPNGVMRIFVHVVAGLRPPRQNDSMTKCRYAERPKKLFQDKTPLRRTPKKQIT